MKNSTFFHSQKRIVSMETIRGNMVTEYVTKISKIILFVVQQTSVQCPLCILSLYLINLVGSFGQISNVYSLIPETGLMMSM